MRQVGRRGVGKRRGRVRGGGVGECGERRRKRSGGGRAGEEGTAGGGKMVG